MMKMIFTLLAYGSFLVLAFYAVRSMLGRVESGVDTSHEIVRDQIIGDNDHATVLCDEDSPCAPVINE